jgi:uncharacterized protein
MEIDLALQSLHTVMDHTRSKRLLVTFHGGEPFLQSPPWFDTVCRAATSAALARDISVEFALQSNGSLMTVEHLEVLKRHSIIVGVSLDGLSEQHNAVRGLFAASYRNILLLDANNLLGGIISVLTKASHDHLAPFVAFLEDNRLYNLSFNDYYAVGRGTSSLHLSGEELFEAWRFLLAHMVATSGNGVRDRSMLTKVRKFLHPPGEQDYRLDLRCSGPFCHAGIRMVHVSWEGTLFPCGSSAWTGSGRHRLGHLGEQADPDTWKAALFALQRKDEMYETACRSCPASGICDFGCAAFEKVDVAARRAICHATRLCHTHLLSQDTAPLRQLLAAETTRP